LKQNIEERRSAMKYQYIFRVISILTICIFFSGLTSSEGARAKDRSASSKKILEAVAVIHPTRGNKVTGVVHFVEVKGGVRVIGEFQGLKPGKHGFHIHELGDCTAPDGTSAGGHYNPMGEIHGGPDFADRHVGDLGNITADQTGFASYDRVDNHLSLNGPYSIIGRAIIIHAGEDDFVSQPSGNAGARIACGVIGIEKE
jgi:Cu-Zn family superoxide dismutase